MKIKIKKIPYEKLEQIPQPKHKKPLKPLHLLGSLIRLISIPELLSVGFKYTTEDMEKAEGPCLILMNHSCFLDMEIAFKVLKKKPFSIVCTTDAFIGKSWILRLLGCIPTNKFVTDVTLVSDISYALKKNKASVLMYPEAGYSFDGCATALPPRIGVLAKKLGVPVVTVITTGAFLRDPLYNGLQKRKTQVSAKVKCLLGSNEIKEKSSEEITELIENEFKFDEFARQQREKIEISEDFRADGLHRILYKCPNCSRENKMVGKGTQISCEECGKAYELDKFGYLKAKTGETEFNHIPNWYNWERACVKEEIISGEYNSECDVKIGVICDNKALYMIGDGHLSHTAEGFKLTSDDGKLEYIHSPLSSYSLNADYFWYEIGDVICIGDRKCLYYCFPKENISVTKVRLAHEEIYKVIKRKNK